MDFLRKKAVPPAEEQTGDSVSEVTNPPPLEQLVGANSVASATDVPEPSRSRVDMLARSRHLFNLYGGLIISFLLFYALADYTSYTTAQQRPGQLIFSNTMTQLWTASFRMAFALGASLSLLRLFWPELFRFFRPDSPDEPDMLLTIRFQLTPFQRLCVFLVTFFGLCFLFVMLLLVNLPETISVGR